MTLFEFYVRRYGYFRKEQAEWAKFRRVAWTVAVAMGGKGSPKTESDFFALPLVDEKDSTLSERQVEAFTEAMRKYKALKKVYEDG